MTTAAPRTTLGYSAIVSAIRFMDKEGTLFEKREDTISIPAATFTMERARRLASAILFEVEDYSTPTPDETK